MSLCDTCTNPGRCCTGLGLPLGTGRSALELLIELATVRHGMRKGSGLPLKLGSPSPDDAERLEHVQLGLPFMPLMQRPSGQWLLWCPLLINGRCSDYDNRPALCRHFEPGSDALCCMTKPEEEAS